MEDQVAETVYYCASINQTTGEILHLKMATPTPPAEGVQLDGTYLVHVKEPLLEFTPAEFMEQRYYDLINSAWVTRVSKPNPWATWNGTSWDPNSDAVLQEFRNQRNRKLAVTDWALVEDSPLTEEEKESVRVYRQDLRDAPASNTNLTSLDDAVWPTKPDFL